MGHPGRGIGCPGCPFGTVAAAALRRNAAHLRGAGVSVRHTVPGPVLDMGKPGKTLENPAKFVEKFGKTLQNLGKMGNHDYLMVQLRLQTGVTTVLNPHKSG